MILPQAVLFDFDGVVVDSFKVHYKAWNKAYLSLFNKEIGDFPKILEGKSPIQIASHLSELGGDKSKASTLFNLKGDLLHASTIPPDLLPGVNSIVSFLKSKNVPFGIASNATKQYIANSIQQLKLGFDTFFGVEDYEFPKPNPEPYQMLAKSLGVTEDDFSSVIVFEDSITGVTAAKDAGMIPVGILTQHSEEKLMAAGCKYTFATLLEAQTLFEKKLV